MVDKIIGLPNNTNPYRLAKRQAILEGRLDVAKFTRLAPMLAQPDSDCYIKLAFSLNERGVCLIEGRLTGCLRLICQRCLGPFEWVFELPIKLMVIKSEADEGRVLAGFEALLLSGDSINISDAVEDELLINVLNYPLHEGVCP